MLVSSPFEKLIGSFLSLVKISPAEIRDLTYQLEIQKYKKTHFLLREGEKCQGIFFVNYGFCRIFMRTLEKENTLHFAGECDFLTHTDGLLFDHLSPYYIQANENTEVVFIPFRTILWARNHMKEGERLVRKLWERYCLFKLEEIFSFYNPDPIQRYEELNRRFPSIGQKVSQKIIASYLNITPEHFSYLKSQNRFLK